MTKTDMTSRIKLLLGGNVLELEVTSGQIENLIDIAFDKIKPFITDTKMVTKPYAQVIDLSEDNIQGVVRVYPTDNTLTSNGRMFDFEGIKMDRTSIRRTILGSYPVIDSEIRFVFSNGKLLLECDKIYSSAVTIEALTTPKLEDLKDERALTWIQAYALALTKQVCGRIRSKFKSPNVPVEMDGDTLLSEAQTEMQMLESELQDRQFGPFMILR